MPFIEQPTELITLLVVLSLLPILVVIGTSFLKLSVVFALLRNALGIQQTPPNMALYSLALILSLFIMAPVITEVREKLAVPPSAGTHPSLLVRISEGGLEPYRQFLLKHSSPTQLRFFRQTARKEWPKSIKDKVSDDSMLLLLPAFAVSQLTEAFKIGLLLFLPFIAIDLVVSNILLAMGMMMVSPMTISMPFKLLIFVLVGGWDRLLEQLLLSYR